MRLPKQWILGMMLTTLTARADSPTAPGSCGGPQLHLDPYLESRRAWVSAVRGVSRKLSEFGEVDRCAVLDIRWSGVEAVIRASVPDGRSAVRRVNTPEALSSTVIALLALPNAPLGSFAEAGGARRDGSRASGEGRDASVGASRASNVDGAARGAAVPAPASRSGSTARPAAAVAAADPYPDSLSGLDAMPALDLSARDSAETGRTGRHGRSAPMPTQVEVGAYSSAARLSGSDVYLGGLGAGAFVQLQTSGWLLGASGRVDRVYNLNDTRLPRIDSESVWFVGPSIGRRFVDGKAWIDAVVPLQLAFESSSVVRSASTLPGAPAGSPSSRVVPGTSHTDVRLGAVLRLSFGLGSTFRLFGAVDADISPARLVNPPVATPSEPRPPRWSTGLSAGVLWGAN